MLTTDVDPVQSLAKDLKGGEPVRVLADRSPVYVSGHNSTTARAAARGFASKFTDIFRFSCVCRIALIED